MKNIIYELDLLRKTVIIQWNIKKKFLLLSYVNNKIPDPSNTKQYYASFFKSKHKKLVTQSKIITYNNFLQFKKIERDDETKYSTFYPSSKAKKIINENDIDNVTESIYITITSSIQKSLGKVLGWIIYLVADHNISISRYKPLCGSNYMKLPKGFDHEKGFD